jgi:hypothetical protein
MQAVFPFGGTWVWTQGFVFIREVLYNLSYAVIL